MKRKVFWFGTFRDDGVEIYDKKPEKWLSTVWSENGWGYFNRKDAVKALRGTGVKLPRKNSKQLIPFHIVPAKGK